MHTDYPLLALVIVTLVGCGNTGNFEDNFKNKKIEGKFNSTNETLGTWEIEPTSCVHGKERGFEGIAFGFGNSSPVQALHIDTARNGDNLVEIRLANSEGTKLLVHEKDCKVITGSIRQSNVTLNDRHMFRMIGSMSFDCPASGISGHAEFDGCLPQTR